MAGHGGKFPIEKAEETVTMQNEKHLVDYAAILLFGLISTAVFPVAAQPADYEQTATAEGAANAKPGPRQAPAHVIPVPTEEVSAQVQALISAPLHAHLQCPPEGCGCVEGIG
jgi:hypothetical protein